jgi:predicted ATPase
LEKRLDPEQLVFLDRALPDELAYYNYFKLEPDSKLINSLHKFTYKKVFIMELLPLHKDYARTEDSNAQKELQNEIIKVYKSRSEPVVMVPVLSPKQRVDFILRNL